MDRRAWWATAHRAAKSQTWRKVLSTHACSENSMFICVESAKLILKSTWNARNLDGQCNPKKEWQGRRTRVCRFLSLLHSKLLKTGRYWHKDRQTNGLELRPEMKWYVCGHLSFYRGAKAIQQGASVFEECCWDNFLATWEKKKVDLYLIQTRTDSNAQRLNHKS